MLTAAGRSNNVRTTAFAESTDVNISFRIFSSAVQLSERSCMLTDGYW